MTLVSEFSASHLCKGGALTRPPGRPVGGVTGLGLSTYNFAVLAAVAAGDGFEYGQLAPLKLSPLKREH